MNASPRSWIEISEAALAHNLRELRHAAGPGAEVLAVVKANAYGHGAELCAPALARAGARWFGVTDAAEGARVRPALQAAGFPAAELLVMSGSLPGEPAVIAGHRLTPVVWTLDQIAALAHLQHQKIQIEIDTGMSRQGARPGPELDALLAAIQAADLTLDGVFTHLCASEAARSPHTETQKQRFEHALEQIRAHHMQPKWVHIGNSSTLDNVDPRSPTSAWLARAAHTAGAEPMVRCGLALYGYVLPIAQPPTGGLGVPPVLRPNLQPVLSWMARILATRALAAGDTVGYGATFTAPRPMRIALLAVGYADGLRRELSHPGTNPSDPTGGWVIAQAPDGGPQRCPIVGRVSMNLTVVDITAIPTLSAGDPVTILGPGITAEDHARIAGTIAYEILCGLKAQPRLSS